MKHPEWCGNNSEVNLNQDWCNDCEELISERSSDCFDDHPKEITHRRFIDVPMDWFSTDPDNYSLWLSQSPDQKKPSLYAAFDSSDEQDAIEVEVSELSSFVANLNIALKVLQK